MDFYAPILPAQSESGAGKAVGVQLLSAPVAEKLGKARDPHPLAEPGERLKLVQRWGGKLFEIAPGATPPLRAINDLEVTAAGRLIPFAERASIGAQGAVYSVGSAVSGPPWWVVQEVDVAAAQKKIGGFVRQSLLGRPGSRL